MRAKWSAPIRKYWKISEQMMVKYCDLNKGLSSRRKKLFFRIIKICIGKDRCFIANTERLGNPAISGMVTCGRLNSLFMFSEDKIGIDGEYVLKFVP